MESCVDLQAHTLFRSTEWTFNGKTEATMRVQITAVLVRHVALAALLFGASGQSVAQIELRLGIVAGGGGAVSNATYSGAGTISQAVIGTSTGTTYSASAGFWGGGSIVSSVEVGVDGTPPLKFSMDQNYPNPFNPTTVINFQLAEAGETRLAVFNVLGEEVAVLVDGYQTAGSKSVEFNARKLPSGVYLYRLTTGSFVATKKLMLVK